MTHSTYFKITSVVFLVVTLVHLWRIVTVTPIAFGTSFVPMWASWVGVILAGTLAYHSIKFSKR